jgi:hypothetical protein
MPASIIRGVIYNSKKLQALYCCMPGVAETASVDTLAPYLFGTTERI